MLDRLVVPPKDFEIKRRIVGGVDRPIEELTVDAICRNSGVSRPTFYRHFGSKYDLSSWYAKCVGEFYLDQIGRLYDWQEGLTQHFVLLHEKRDLFYYGSESSQDIYLAEAMQLHRRQVLAGTLKERGVAYDSEMDFCVNAYAFLETGLAARWMRHNMDQDPVELAHYLVRCIPSTLYEALRM